MCGQQRAAQTSDLFSNYFGSAQPPSQKKRHKVERRFELKEELRIGNGMYHRVCCISVMLCFACLDSVHSQTCPHVTQISFQECTNFLLFWHVQARPNVSSRQNPTRCVSATALHQAMVVGHSPVQLTQMSFRNA